MLRRMLTLLLLAMTLSLGPLTLPAPVQAGYATGGTGPYQGSIYWLDWTGSAAPANGRTKTWSGTADGLPAGVSITSTLTTVSNPTVSGCGTQGLSFQPMQTWSGATVFTAYNPSGLPAIGDVASCSDTWSVAQNVSLTVNGVTAAPDVVWVDAESTNGVNENLAATTTGGAWENIQDIQGDGATGYWTGALSNANKTITLTQTESPKSVPLMVSRGATGVSNATVTTSSRTGGKQAYALGIVLSYDLGDAPDSYAAAVHRTQWTDTNTDRAAPDVGPTFFTSTIYLGTQSPDAESSTGADWTGDDTTTVGIAGPDEGTQQLLGAPTFPTLATGATTYSVTVRCTGSGAPVRGWIDADRNGTFDTGERATATCSGGNATLAFTFPALTGAASVGARFRIASVAADVNAPTGMAANGEVEDIQIPVANLVITKSVAPGGPVTAGSTLTWTISIANTGTAPALGATFVDAIPAGATYVANSTTLNGTNVAGADFRTSREVHSAGAANGVLAAGSTTTIVFQTTVNSGVLSVCNQGQAQFTASSGAVLTDDPSVTGAANPTCIGVTSLDVAKTAGSFTGPSAAGIYQQSYTVTVTNAGVARTYGALTDTPQFSSALTVTGASWTATSSAGAAPAAGTATGAGPFTLAPSNTAIAQGAVHTFTVLVSMRINTATAATACAGPGTGTYNAVALPGGQETGTGANNAACATPPTLPAASLTLLKRINGQDADTLPGVALDAGATMSFTFVVTNTGQTRLAGVTVTDDVLAAASISCPQSVLAIGASMTCTASRAAPAPGVRHHNTATATGQPTYANGTNLPGSTVNDTDEAHAWTVVTTPLPLTGGESAQMARVGAGLAGLLFVAGGLYLGTSRRRRVREVA